MDVTLDLGVMERLKLGENHPTDEPYRYQSLPTLTSIRVLRVRGKDNEGALCVSLKIIDLADDPVFYALSYTWGNPHANGVDFTAHYNAVNDQYTVRQKAPVLCDGKRLDVQRNLLDVLREFGQASSGPQEQEGRASSTGSPFNLSDREFYIWVDAICINQEDMEERALQVRIMDQIYTKAAHTIIWLGCEDEWTAPAAETIKRVAGYPRNVFKNSEVNPFRRQDPDVYSKSSLSYTSWMDWCSLAALLKRQWFLRLWIVQETILSGNLSLLCGKHKISWSELVTAARNIEARCNMLGWSPSIMFLQAHEIAVPLEHNVLRLADWRDFYHNKVNNQEAWRFTLENLLYDTWIFNSTDPRDKIYGILGMVDPKLRAEWEIDYSSPAEKAYALTTRCVIEDSRSLKILSCVQDASKRQIATYPSWVPDYSLPYFNMMCNHGAFSAAGSQHPHPQLLPSPSWSRLRLRAHILDTIVETGNDRSDYVNSAMLLEPSWFELALLLKTPYPATGQKRTEVLWRTLCADQDASSTTSPAPAGFAALFKELVCAMVMVRAELEEEASQEPDPAEDCAASFCARHAEGTADLGEVGWDERTPESIREKTNARPRFLARPQFGWLVHTLIKLQALALTEDGGVENSDTPSWGELERFYENPTYVMRVKSGAEKSLVQPKDAAFSNSFRKRYGKRKLFYTEKGYLGLGPASAAVGDVVYILPGAAGPFVFREDKGGGVKDNEEVEKGGSGVKLFRLVGESYVHGVMYGEISKLDDFVLKEIEIV